MTKKKVAHEEVLENRAQALGSVQQAACDTCASPFVFALKDNFHEFSLDLVTVLKCLKFAENEGAVPPLPSDWWFELHQRYKDINYFTK